MRDRTVEDSSTGWIIAAVMVVPGALAGVAALLRSKNEEMTTRAILSAVFNSAIFSVAVLLVCFHYFGLENAGLCVGLSLLAGLGGNTTLGIGLRMWEVAGGHIARREGGDLRRVPDNDSPGD